MSTPICDFVNKYIENDTSRLHMPGHKGVSLLGMERYDITEISGADSLYEAEGIIRKSEEIASRIFDCPTFYSTEGSSHSIRAMIYLAYLFAKKRGENLRILAQRNAHKTFLSAVALLDAEVEWLMPDGSSSYLSCKLSAEEIKKVLSRVDKRPNCLYLTSPDYLGNMVNIREIAAVCKEYGVLLIVDNAHGAYLKLLENGSHPIEQGADMCCDSAHKTLPCLTGGAYLHISKNADPVFKNNAKDALSLFGSTSPSYLILQSLDKVNGLILDGYDKRLQDFDKECFEVKEQLKAAGYVFCGEENTKFTVETKKYGYRGTDFAQIMRNNHNLECEFSDPDYAVFMLSPLDNGLNKLKDALLSVEKREAICDTPPHISLPKRAMSVRDVILSPSETVTVDMSLGRVLSVCTVSCPPAVPILMSGEIIDENCINAFRYYGIRDIKVVLE